MAVADPEAFLSAVAYVWPLVRGGVGKLGRPEGGYPIVACSHGCSVKCGTEVRAAPGQFVPDVSVRMLKCVNNSWMKGSHPAYEGTSAQGEQLAVPRPPGLGELGIDLGNLIEDLGLTSWFYDTWYRYLGGLQALGIREILGEPFDLENPLWWRELITNVAHRRGLGDDVAEGLARFYAKHSLGPAYLAELIESAGSRGHGWHREGRAMEPHPSPYWEHSALLYAVSTRDVTPSTHGFFFLNREYGYPEAPKDASAVPESLRELATRVYGSPKAVYPGDEYVEHTAVWHQHRAIIKDSLGVCDWVFPVMRRSFDDAEAREAAAAEDGDGLYGDVSAEALLFRACTGIDLSIAEMERPIAERVVNLERCLDIRNTGRDRAGDEAVIPHYQWGEKTDRTRLSVDGHEFRALLDRYYDLRGWDRSTGAPSRATVTALGLDDLAEPAESEPEG